MLSFYWTILEVTESQDNASVEMSSISLPSLPAMVPLVHLLFSGSCWNSGTFSISKFLKNKVLHAGKLSQSKYNTLNMIIWEDAMRYMETEKASLTGFAVKILCYNPTGSS